MAHSDHQPRSKQHAQRRDAHRRYPLWVYEDDDWRAMKDFRRWRAVLPEASLPCRVGAGGAQDGDSLLSQLAGTVGLRSCVADQNDTPTIFTTPFAHIRPTGIHIATDTEQDPKL
jgi:hypothetical protein